MNLYIVTTGLPGPDPSECGFVELEDESGASVGPSSTGADWHPVPGADLYRLGPFAPVASRRAPSRTIAAEAAEDIVRALAAGCPTRRSLAPDHPMPDITLCGLCGCHMTAVDVPEQHEHDCPWRLAVEWVAREKSA